MTIEIVWGAGEGGTELSAFDSALKDAGIHNYNLVTLSSVIPEYEDIEIAGTHERTWNVGDMVGVVLAENRSAVNSEKIAAGLGWATADQGGVFFEATAESAENVNALLERGIQTAKRTRSRWDWHDGIATEIQDHVVDENGAVVVSAVYRPVWEDPR